MHTLRELRKEKGFYQKEISAKLGVDRTTYSKWETGENEPSLEMLTKLAEVFDVSVDYLLGKDSPENPEKKRTVRYRQRNVRWRTQTVQGICRVPYLSEMISLAFSRSNAISSSVQVSSIAMISSIISNPSFT